VLAADSGRLAESDTPWLDALLLLCWASGLGKERVLAELSARADTILIGDTATRYSDAIDRRSSGVPVAAITGVREFWSLPFAVGPGVLIPRPDSERLVEISLELLAGRTRVSVRDCCTGSGAIGISIAHQLAQREVAVSLELSDVSADALVYARRNAETFLDSVPHVDVSVFIADGVDGGSPPFDLVCANPPYLTSEETSAVLRRGWGEPREALDGGEDGLALYPMIAHRAYHALSTGGALIVECAPDQADRLARLFSGTIGYTNVEVFRDAAGRNRGVVAQKVP
jgi:release factor glutamine methyltransferase